MTRVLIRKEGDRVLLIKDGRLLMCMPRQSAEQLGRALISKAKQIEEEEKAVEVIADQALLHRIGVPLALSTHPKILKEAHKESQHDPTLRKHVQGKRAKGPGPVLYAPTVKQRKPK